MKKTVLTGLTGPGKNTSGGVRRPSFFLTALLLAVFCCLPALYAEDTRPPINVNLIIDGSLSLSPLKDEIAAWVSGRFDEILVNGDTVTVWSAEDSARVIYSGVINGSADREAAKRSIRELTPTGQTADFSGALREASSRQSSTFSYTLLISASPAALTSVLSGPQANLLRFSRVEEFPGWRALVVGLNLEARVRRSAVAFFSS